MPPSAKIARLAMSSIHFRFTRRCLLAAAAALLCLPAGAGETRANEPGKVFRAGVAAVDISPNRFPISLAGSMRDNPARGVGDTLYARAIVLDDGRTRLAIVVCDSCMIPRDLMDAAKSRAAEKAGLPVERMLVSATHSHTAPTVTGVFQSDPDAEYREFLTEKIAEAIVQAASKLEPARVGWGVGSDPTQVFNRRWLVKEGTVLTDPFGGTTDRVKMNPGYALTNDRPSGPVDPQVSLLAVQRPNGDPLALLANYSLHYVGGVPGGLASGDYFGEFSRRMAARLGAGENFLAVMSNGTSGNINNVDFSQESRPRREPYEQIRIVAASVVDAAYKAYQNIQFHDWVPLQMAEREVELGVRLPSEADVAQAKELLAAAGEGPYSDRSHIYARETLLLKDYPAKVKARLQAIRIGELGIVSTPCETFVETGLAIKKDSPLQPTFTIELANGYNGYLPTPEHHDLGGYETWRARSSYLDRDAEPKIRATLLELLNEVAAAGKN